MIRVSVLYPNHPGSHFDVEYYLNTHIPLTNTLLGPIIKELTVDIGSSGTTPGSAPPFAAIFSIACESVESFTSAFMPNVAQLQGDIPNYTNIEPVIQISEIRIG